MTFNSVQTLPAISPGPILTPEISRFLRQPKDQPRSSIYSLRANGQIVDVLDAGLADFAILEWTGTVEIQVSSTTDLTGTRLKPFRHGIEGRSYSGAFIFDLDKPCNVCVDVPGGKPLFVYACPPELEKPSPADSMVRFYAAGRIYEEGTINLRSGETLYIEAGAILRATVFSEDSNGVRIAGYGILDGSLTPAGDNRSVIFQNCTDVSVENITMIHPVSWMLVFGRCNGVHVRNIKEIGCCMTSDGIDICGSSNVLVEDCCLRNEDDNIAIKSVLFPDNDWRGNVENIVVRRCILLNGRPGNSMEIGYELRAEYVRNVLFEDIDVIYAHGDGAVFSIHNGDRAVVENVRWENIRVEHYWDKLVDLRVVKARYNEDAARGVIRNIVLKNIRVVHSVCNPGCSISVVGGYTPENPVRDVVFEDFYLNDLRVETADQLELYTRNAENIVFA